MRRYFIKPSWKNDNVFSKSQWLMDWKYIFSHLIFQEGVGWKPKSINISCTGGLIRTKIFSHGHKKSPNIPCNELLNWFILCILPSICTHLDRYLLWQKFPVSAGHSEMPISIFPFPEDDELIVGSNCSGDTNCNDERTDSGIVMTALRISGSREIISLLFPDFSAWNFSLWMMWLLLRLLPEIFEYIKDVPFPEFSVTLLAGPSPPPHYKNSLCFELKY